MPRKSVSEDENAGESDVEEVEADWLGAASLGMYVHYAFSTLT